MGLTLDNTQPALASVRYTDMDHDLAKKARIGSIEKHPPAIIMVRVELIGGTITKNKFVLRALSYK